MLNNYFQQELSNLKDISREFAKENPAIAPMLGESSLNPDIERLLESVAFLTGSIRERIDDEIPEIIHNFLRQVWPHYLRCVPSSTIIEFSPENHGATGIVPAGTYIDSMPIEGTRCRYQTCHDVEIPPIKIVNIKYNEPDGTNPVIRLECELASITANQWDAKKINFYLGGGLKQASDLYFILMTNLNRIIIRSPENKQECILDKSFFKPAGLKKENALLPFPSNSFQGYRLLQEYFHMPEKFLFCELSGLDAWKHRGKTTHFYIDFELVSAPLFYFKLDQKSFVLSAVPAINIFKHPSSPVVVDHKKTEYRVSPAGNDKTKYQIYSIEKVAGVIKGIGKEQRFEPFHSFKLFEDNFIYNETICKSPVYNRIDYNISLAYPKGFKGTDLSTLSFDILCTNGNLPEMIDHRGISIAVSTLPVPLKIKNLIQPTTAVLPPLGTNMLWRLVSMVTINSSSLSDIENLKTILKLHLMKEGNRDKKRILANEKRINGIKALETKNVERLINGSMRRGVEIRLKISRSHFAGMGDLYLLGTILDVFFGMYASMNTFTQFVINEIDTGEIFSWQGRLGDRQLI